jgi:hypothetical protein
MHSGNKTTLKYAHTACAVGVVHASSVTAVLAAALQEAEALNTDIMTHAHMP